LALAVSTSKLLLDHLANTPQRPQFRGKPLRQRPFLQQLYQIDSLLRVQTRWTTARPTL
jgi:hypothetical protein